IPVEGTFAAYREGERVVVTGVLRDISERLRAEEALRRSEASFRALIEGEPDAVFVDRDAAIVYANPAAAKLVGGGDLAGEQLARLLPEIQTAAPGAEQRLVTRAGAELPVHVSRVGIVSQGRPAELVVARDLSEHKRLQAQLLLGDRLSAIGTLSAGMAHEINNPLAYVMANTLWVAESLEGREGTLVQALRESLEGCERIRRIVSDLKTFARGGESVSSVADVRKVLDFATTIAANQIRHRGRIVKDYQPVPRMAGDEARLGQVVLNLLLNAIAALPEDSADRNEIRLSTRSAGGQVVIEVADNGVGIPPETLKRVFEPFFTTRAVGAGTGLG